MAELVRLTDDILAVEVDLLVLEVADDVQTCTGHIESLVLAEVSVENLTVNLQVVEEVLLTSGEVVLSYERLADFVRAALEISQTGGEQCDTVTVNMDVHC